MIAQSSDRQRDHWIVAMLEIKINAGFYIHVKLGLKKYPEKTNMQRLSILLGFTYLNPLQKGWFEIIFV